VEWDKARSERPLSIHQENGTETRLAHIALTARNPVKGGHEKVELYLSNNGVRIQRAYELHQSRLRESAVRRLLRAGKESKPRRHSLRDRVLVWVGIKLVVYGKRLQRQYN
jgi:hypothetical protein